MVATDSLSAASTICPLDSLVSEFYDLQSMTTLVRNPHDTRMEKSWQFCRQGIEIVRTDPEKLQAVRKWVVRMLKKTRNPHYQSWLELLDGVRIGDENELRFTQDFVSLPAERKSVWRPLVQTTPFVPLFVKQRRSA